jgi:hypothetical protein
VSITQRDRRALILLVSGLLMAALLYYVFPANSPSPVSAVAENPARVQLQLARLRQVSATLTGQQVILKQAAADLADRERGIVQADTAAQGQAALLEIARRIGKEENLDVRGGDFAAPRTFGDYGLVYATVTFDCRIEQLVNFLADLAKEPELVVPAEEHIASGNTKDKTMNVRIVLAGVVPKKLVPEKKGLASF